ncbi:hypothetical protein BDZ89DRAFT_1137386 [Hymenopellis radicata]|nr:hypothetical protein BDZ89DRAFT_1137386 [Hymenopellis radicata]
MSDDEDDDEFFDEDPDLDYDELGFHQVAFKVRSLSYALWTTGQHQYCEDAPTLHLSAHDPARASMMAIFRAFATLLTRDSRSQLVAVTGDGPPSTQSNRVLALVPTGPHSLGPSQYEDLVTCSVLSYEDIRPSDSAALPAFLLESVAIPERVCSNPIEPPDRSPCQATDVEHAEHILQIISVSRHAVGERQSRMLQLALEYTVHQCWTEVTTRFMASNYIFAGPPLVDVLRGWEPAVEDQRYLPPLANVPITWLPVEDEAAASRLRKTDVPVHPHAHKTFLFDWSTVQGWLQTLVDTLAILMDSVTRRTSNKSL